MKYNLPLGGLSRINISSQVLATFSKFKNSFCIKQTYEGSQGLRSICALPYVIDSQGQAVSVHFNWSSGAAAEESQYIFQLHLLY